MSKRSDALYLGHMVEMCRIVGTLVEGASRADLDADIKLQLALARAVSIVGEAARHVSEPFRAAHPDIDWSAIMGMRHKLVHDYFDVDLDIVWRAATVQVPALLQHLEPFAP